MVYDKGSEPPSVTWNRYEGKSFNTYAVYATGTDNKLVLIDNVASNGNESQTYIIPPRFQGYKKYCAVALFDDLFYSTTKSSSGPYSLSLSNLAESKLLSSRDVSGNISLLPCPAGDYVEINQLSDFDSYQVTNCIGQVIVEGVLSSRFIDLRDLPAGIYSMILRGSLSYAVKTFAKQ
jgi:hypothetical protein